MITAQLHQTEKQLEQAVVDYSKLMGWLSYHSLNSKGSEAGFPDRVFVRAQRLLFIEFKAERGRVSKAQQRWLDALGVVAEEALRRAEHLTQFAARPGHALRAQVEVYVWRPSDWDELVKVLRWHPGVTPNQGESR